MNRVKCCDTVIAVVDEVTGRSFISGVGEIRALALASGFLWTLRASNDLVFDLGTVIPYADAQDGDTVKFHGFYFADQSTMFGLVLIDGVITLCWHNRRCKCKCIEKKKEKDCGCNKKKSRNCGDITLKVKAETWC